MISSAKPSTSGALGSPALMRFINMRQIIAAMRELGPCSRVDLTRKTALSAPTISKLMLQLERLKLVEPLPAVKPTTTGRPSVIYQLASRDIQFLGAVVDIRECHALAAGYDGRVDPAREIIFPTPPSYRELIKELARQLRRVANLTGAEVMGTAISVPGLLNRLDGRPVLSPNLHFMDGRNPAADLERATGFPTVVVQEEHALCLSEQLFGQALGLDHFAMIDISAGMGLGVVSHGQFLSGARGYAGELGHVTVEPGGLPCGCGSRGCFETVATDTAFLKAVQHKTGHAWSMDEVIERVGAGELDVSAELERTLSTLAIAVGIVINLFNPSHLFLYGRIFDVDPECFHRLLHLVRRHAIQPSVNEVAIVRARGCKRQGAIAAILEHHTERIAPGVR